MSKTWINKTEVSRWALEYYIYYQKSESVKKLISEPTDIIALKIHLYIIDIDIKGKYNI